ncbi:hypothetical protein NDU88_001474 [Pleurodeles waltl]|uniref:Integrase catalytic domain-containing protein n=1 Tax=Pleurodeles waltl TaxID=8319 RepID=A0AAV7P492_PLEWA|nr:hypothetical protein NDU88_001474 [Pleurodeles waltl]
MDFGSLPDGRHTLILVNDFSKYPEVEVISSLSAEVVIPRLEKIMATHGLISEIKTDNGPPFQSKELSEYFEKSGVCHRRITPRWPQANGEVERFMRTLNKVLRIAYASGQVSEYAIYSFLRNYLQTPHSTTGKAPGHVMFGRPVVDSIPHHRTWVPNPIDPVQVQERRSSTNRFASRPRRASDLKVEDQVLLKVTTTGSKFRMPFDPVPWRVVKRRGSLVVARRGTDVVTRNVSLFKKFNCPEGSQVGAEVQASNDDQWRGLWGTIY